ncbi:acetyoacetyl CoA reductase [Legionella geestiana]|uniref:Acetyoacetyl CoA reductase n=1 Tax=Legionella geestiana TaxID=45065 RepID=A0A0W0TYT4_9GAMM|nr:acetoacetyl-CoA reductase [Legionella geestiana]KTD00978.1 acetyoacetyl CoA reductase [Legionella geestiana]QBS12007.1 acetoacetyl-CoA reductase [Legionella geestiana]QDQ40383.1 acetoacetyl-CoA reductase [Legionella geestiana]STX53275.1 3-oxoacyl-[acyl-carrier-protein] reductase [Legionella geestiana]
MERDVVVVTGGTGGIGTAICQRFAPHHQVIACYCGSSRHDAAKRWQEAQHEAGFNVDILYGDVTVFEDCEKLCNLVAERYGRLDVLVNNAGITMDASLKKMTPEQWRGVLSTNLDGVFNMTRNALPFMLKSGYGRIVSISSINGRKGQRGQCNYAASKAALYGFTKSLAQEVAAQGVTVNTVSPGYIKTAMLEEVREEVIRDIVAHIPEGHLGTPADVAHAVAFLASRESAFITGANLDVNGGQYM